MFGKIPKKSGMQKMSAVEYYSEARGIVRERVQQARGRCGSLERAKDIVAREHNLPRGFVRQLWEGGPATIHAHLWERLQQNTGQEEASLAYDRKALREQLADQDDRIREQDARLRHQEVQIVTLRSKLRGMADKLKDALSAVAFKKAA